MGLSKVGLIARINARAADRYGAPIDEVWLNDRIKDGLIDALDRGPNAGVSPQYFAAARHYRRALQIKRLESSGITSRNALLIQLFIRKYGISASVVGSALGSELRKAVRRLQVQLKSNYFARYRSIGLKHRDIISRQLGEIDKRFAHLELPVETYYAIARGFFRHDFERDRSLLSGILASGLPLFAEVTKSSPTELRFAADMLFDINRVLLRPHFGNAVFDSPDIVSVLLSLLLRLGQQGASIEYIMASVGDPVAFRNLFNDFTERVERFRATERFTRALF